MSEHEMHAERLLSRAAHNREMAHSRRSSAAISEGMTRTSAREAAALASQMAGHRIPAGSPSEWRESARRGRAIADTLDREAVSLEAGAVTLREIGTLTAQLAECYAALDEARRTISVGHPVRDQIEAVLQRRTP